MPDSCQKAQARNTICAPAIVVLGVSLVVDKDRGTCKGKTH